MSFQKAAIFSGLAALANAHGHVTGIVADGTYFQGFDLSMAYQSSPPAVVGWGTQALDNGFVAPSAFGTSDIICHKSATNAQTHGTVAAGGDVTLQWDTWPESHKGPVIDYLAACNGECETVDKTTLEWFKIDGVGMLDGSTVPAKFASDTLIANNNSWTVTIPSALKAGNYVLRHEIIALHGAGSTDGAQNYPQCVNLEITGGGSTLPAGVVGTELYTESDPGILINIYQTLSTYVVPGPTLAFGDSGSSATATAAPATSATASAASSVATSATSVSVVDAVTSTVAASTLATSAPASSASATSAAAITSAAKPITSATATADITSLIPSTLLTEVLPTAIPTDASTGATPSVALPEGTTVKDLLDWLSYMVGNYFNVKSTRNHARALKL